MNPADLPLTRRVLAFATMCLGMFIALLDIQIVSASLRDIGGALSAGVDETVWIQTSYLIGEIIMIPLTGWLARLMSTRWLFAASAAGFTAASLLCGLAFNIQSMIAFRALQGFVGGAMIPMVFTTAFAFFQGPQRVIAAAVVGSIASFAPTLGPTLGGWITEHFSWHWLFLVNLVPGLFIAVTVPRLVNVDRPNWQLWRGADYLGIVLLAVCLGCLEYALEEGPRLDWLGDRAIAGCALAAALSGLLFIWRSLAHPQPVVDLRALGDRNFALGCLFSFVTGIGIFATIYLTPVFLGRVRGFSALQIGLAVASTGLFQVLAIPIYSALANRVDLRWLMMFGLGLFALSMWQFAPITHDWGGAELLWPQALRGAAQSFAVPPIVTLTLGGLPPARLQYASGLFNLMRNLGGAIGIAGCATLINDRTNLHFARLAERLGAANEAMQSLLASVAQRAGSEGALALLRQLTLREALTMSFADIYLLVMACFALTVVLVPLMRAVVPPRTPSADAH